jgi:hypothetical protein
LQINTKEYESLKLAFEEGVDIGFGIKESLLPNVVF